MSSRTTSRRRAGGFVVALALGLGVGTTQTGATQTGAARPGAGSLVPATTPSAGASSYTPVGPSRLADTRGDGFGFTQVDDTTIRVEVADRTAVADALAGGPAEDEVVAASLTVTAVAPTGDGFVTVHPAGTPRPEASNLNHRAGEVRANGVLVRLGEGGAVDIHTSEPADLLVDVTGVFISAGAGTATAGRFVPTDPSRRLDTRGGDVPGADSELSLSAATLGVPADASAVAVNLTAVDTLAPGFFTVWPGDAERPDTSVLNADAAGQTRAAFAIVPLGDDGGGISTYTSNGAHLLLDVVGWFTGADATASDVGLFVPRDPERVFDTRPTAWKLVPRAVTDVDGILPDALAVAANWTTVDANGASFLSAYPDVGPPTVSDPPEVSTVNTDGPGTAVANLAITPIGPFGVVASSFAGEHAIADVAGYFTGEGGTASLTPPPEPEPLPGALPAPDRAPRPPATQLAGVPLRLEPALDVPNLTAMEWSVLDEAYYATTQDGTVRRIPADLSSAEMVLDMTSEVTPLVPFSEKGLLGIAFDPVDGRMFLHFTDQAGDSQLVSYAMVDGAPDPASRRQVLSLSQPGLGHQGGQLEFDADGQLFVAFGDGGGSSGRDAQDDTKLHGTISRIVPNRGGDGYTVPSDNPAVGDPNRRDEIWVSGLRNPWRFSIDPATGDTWIADVGENDREELNVVPAGTHGGLDFGWYWFEGTRDRGYANVPDDQYFVPPVFEYGHTDGVSVIGGAVYHGDGIPDLTGAYVFADMSGPFFAYGAAGGTRLPLIGGGTITGFVETPERELLVTTLRDGLFRLRPG